MDYGVRTGDDGFYLGSSSTSADRGETSSLGRDLERTWRRVAPALQQVLEDDASSSPLLASAAIALAKLGESPVRDSVDSLAALEALLAHRDRQVVESAIVALGVLASESSAFLLCDFVLEGPRALEATGRTKIEGRLREHAAYALALLGERSEREDVRRYVVGRLAHALEQDVDDPELAIACVTAFGLTPMVSRGHAVDREQRSTPSRSREHQIAFLLEPMSNPRVDRRIRAHAATALARLSAPLGEDDPARVLATEALLEVCSSRSRAPVELQESALLALGELGDNDLGGLDDEVRTTILRSLRKTGHARLREFALLSLAQVASRDGSGPEDPTEVIDEARTLLVKALASGSTPQRPWAAMALGVLEASRVKAGHPASPEVAQALRESFRRAKSPEEVSALAIGLGLMGDQKSADLLQERFDDTSLETTRGYLATGLGFLGDRRATDELLEGTRAGAGQPTLVREASIALRMLGLAETVPALLESLDGATTLASRRPLIVALGYAGDHRTLDPLVKIMASGTTTELVRAEAATALGRICSERTLPWNHSLAANFNYRAAPPSLLAGQGSGVLERP